MDRATVRGATPICRLVPSSSSLRGVLGALADRPGLVAFSGSWGPGRAIVASDPIRRRFSHDGAAFEHLDTQPDITDGSGEAQVGGGWFGYLGYQLARHVERLPPPPPSWISLPRSQLGFYDHVWRLDQEGRWWFEALWTDERAAVLTERYEQTCAALQSRPPPPRATEFSPFETVPDRRAHVQSVGRAIDHILAGDIFQANITLQLRARYSGDPLSAFVDGVEAFQPALGAFLRTARGAVVSFSPELFLARRGRTLLTSPIKGTVRRTGGLDATETAALVRSPKNRAENIMIVDLMRNDFGRVCIPGSIGVPALLRPEAHPGLWHLVSDVTGELPPDVRDSAVLRATFPPGSVTGAPKVRAMQIINGLEATRREVYTGALVMKSPLLGLMANVAIRTFEFTGGRVWLGSGGGIVADSNPGDEFEECLVKAEPLIRGIGGRLTSGP